MFDIQFQLGFTQNVNDKLFKTYNHLKLKRKTLKIYALYNTVKLMENFDFRTHIENNFNLLKLK